MNANIHFAKTHLSKLIEQALAGEEVVIARAGKPLVRLTPVEEITPSVKATPSGSGISSLTGTVKVPTDEEWAEMDREVEQMFEESYIFPENSPEGVRERAGEVLDFTTGPKKVIAAE